MNILGIIPARGGSKGVLRKNIRLVGGIPLIAHTINAAKGSVKLTSFVTSTEDEKIADISREYESEVIKRPLELAGDRTPMIPVIESVLSTVESTMGYQDYIVLLQPTTPMRSSDDIDNAISIILNTGADSVISVYQVEDHHPSRMYNIIDNRVVPYTTEPPGSLRQELPPVYHRNGAIYAFKRSLLQEKGIIIGADTRPYIMPRERSINIDDELDLAFADFLLCQRKAFFVHD